MSLISKYFFSYFYNKIYSLVIDKRDDSLLISGLLFSISKEGEIKIEKRFFDLSFNEFINLVDKKYPILFNYIGEDVISKLIKKEKGYLKKILFRSNADEFYINEIETEDQIAVSVSRKSIINELISEFEIKKIYVLKYSLGPFSLKYLNDFFEDLNIVSDVYHQISITNHKIEIFDITENANVESYFLQEEEFNQKNISALSNLLTFIKEANSVNNSEENIINNIKEFKFKKINRFLLPGLLFFLLLSFAGTTVYKNKLINEYLNLSHQVDLYEEENRTLNYLEKEVKNRQRILQLSGFNNLNYYTLYISDIINQQGQEIVLNSLNVQPIDNVKSKELIKIKNDLIVIEGNVVNEKSFDKWIKKISKLNWVNKVAVLNYSQDKFGENKFEVEIFFNQ